MGLSVRSPVYSLIHSKAEIEPLVCDSASLGFLNRRVPWSDARREEMARAVGTGEESRTRLRQGRGEGREDDHEGLGGVRQPKGG